LEHAAATFTPAPLGVSEITVPAAIGKLGAVADEVVTIVSRFGGSATKGLPDKGRLSVLVDLPSNRETEFRAAISSMIREAPGSPTPATAAQESGSMTPPTGEKKSFVVQITEANASGPK